MDAETDRLIRAAVRDEDRRVEALLDETSDLPETIIQSFRGRARWLTLASVFMGLVYTGLLVWCAVEFFDSDTTKHQIGWATGFLASAISIGLTKIWIWGEWRRQSVMREIKRLELRVGALCDRLGD